MTEPLSLSQTLVTGVYRTGTEYLVSLVQGHPELSATMYRVNAIRFLWGRYDPIDDPAQRDAAIAAVARRVRERYAVELDAAAVRAALPRSRGRGYGALYDALVHVLEMRPGQTRWLEKNQLQWRAIPAFLDASGDGRAVVLLRDPRSVLASFKRFTTAPEPAYLGAAFNCLDCMSWMRALHDERVLVLRYEDLLDDPDAAREQVFRHCGADPALAAPREAATMRDAYGRPWRHNSAFHERGREVIDTAAALTRWRHALTAAETAFVERLCGEAMRAWGYEPAARGADDTALVRACEADPRLAPWWRHWQVTGEGACGFPSDPLDPRTWSRASAAE